ncbi:unnamed protein product [Protopolystoma xenopodis]|uniref:Uncharacterized protein n=1 Tax=Protopolystoma xenopodis TaxID=117903 RepID=A0A3S5FEX8_9PLAT|nr:unnamed protein product [Protopolystoma xenopodis]
MPIPATSSPPVLPTSGYALSYGASGAPSGNRKSRHIIQPLNASGTHISVPLRHPLSNAGPNTSPTVQSQSREASIMLPLNTISSSGSAGGGNAPCSSVASAAIGSTTCSQTPMAPSGHSPVPQSSVTTGMAIRQLGVSTTSNNPKTNSTLSIHSTTVHQEASSVQLGNHSKQDDGFSQCKNFIYLSSLFSKYFYF